jgi:hypothetical protein
MAGFAGNPHMHVVGNRRIMAVVTLPAVAQFLMRVRKRGGLEMTNRTEHFTVRGGGVFSRVYRSDEPCGLLLSRTSAAPVTMEAEVEDSFPVAAVFSVETAMAGHAGFILWEKGGQGGSLWVT